MYIWYGDAFYQGVLGSFGGNVVRGSKWDYLFQSYDICNNSIRVDVNQISLISNNYQTDILN
jgi:hypothetical protein